MKYTKITISGKICTGKSTLFKKLKKILKWPTVETGQYFRNYVKKHHLDLEKAQEQSEKLTLKIDNQVRDRLKTPTGHLLADSWMSGVMADNFPHILRILLICDDQVRYQRFANRENIPLEEAKKRVNERQQSWIDRLKIIYHRDDFFDPKNFNLVIDTTLLSVDETLQKVLDHLKFAL